jgi:hypothetical protein
MARTGRLGEIRAIRKRAGFALSEFDVRAGKWARNNRRKDSDGGRDTVSIP